MWSVVKRLWLGVTLLVLASAFLLVSDWTHRRAGHRRVPQVALLEYAPGPITEVGSQGILAGLAENGYVDGRSMALRQYSAQGDVGTLNAIARDMATGEYDLLLTMTTPCLQGVANANRAGRTRHVFGLVTDPFVAGVGLRRDDPLDHPRHLVGIGSFEPVASNIRYAKALNPDLHVIGAVWNPGEANSGACLVKARAVCRELGIELVEANAENSAAVMEAASSLVGRGAQALWVGGDNTANIAIDAIIAVGRKARIPVFTTNIGSAERGALFDLGPDYAQVGRLIGELGARILRGTDPRTIPIRDVVPEQVMVNLRALPSLKDRWVVPDALLARADIVIDDRGTHRNTVAGGRQPEPVPAANRK